MTASNLDLCMRDLHSGGWWRANVFDGVDLRRVLGAFLAAHWLACGHLSVFFVFMSWGVWLEVVLHGLILVVLAVVIGLMQFILSTGRRLRWWFLSLLCAFDFLALSASVAVGGGFDSDYLYLFYCPVVAVGGVVFGSIRVNLVWCGCVAASYVVLCLLLGDGVDLVSRDGKVLLARVLVMNLVNVVVAVSCMLERLRWRDAVHREQALLRERAQTSRSVHDTTAQIAYVVSLGLDAAVASAESGGSPLLSKLRSSAELARAMVWQLRHVINVGGIYEGEGLRSSIQFHAVSFTNVTTVPAQFSCRGQEPDLPVDVKRVVFGVAHNSMTNVYRHAAASRVTVDLCYRPSSVCLTVSDDGCGLPADYAGRGHGFRNMRLELSRVGGRLFVERVGALGGATVGCVVPVTGIRGGSHGI